MAFKGSGIHLFKNNTGKMSGKTGSAAERKVNREREFTKRKSGTPEDIE